MNRDDVLQRLRARSEGWDIIVVGGGATGVGVALDAASRGYDVALLDHVPGSPVTSAYRSRIFANEVAMSGAAAASARRLRSFSR